MAYLSMHQNVVFTWILNCFRNSSYAICARPSQYVQDQVTNHRHICTVLRIRSWWLCFLQCLKCTS